MRQTLIQFLAEDAKKQSELQVLATKLGVPLGELQKIPAKDIKTILHYVGKHDYAPNSDFNAKELRMGIEVESEHTDNELVAELITKDHLKEFPNYYTKLAKMEKEARQEANQKREHHVSDFL